MYSFFGVVLIAGVYGVYVFKNIIEPQQGNIVFHSNDIPSVQADFVAKVVDFNGNFYIEDGSGQMFQSSMIGNGQTVTLLSGAQIIFHIQTGAQAKIVGPAKFTVVEQNTESIEKKYSLRIIQGDFVEMQSLANQTNSSDVEVTVDDIVVHQQDINVPMHFQIKKQGDQKIVSNLSNNWGNLLITKKIDEQEDVETVIASQQLARIQDTDITLLNDPTLVADAIKKGEITQTFSLAITQDENSAVETGKEQTGLDLAVTASIVFSGDMSTGEVDSGVVDQAQQIISDEKKVFSPEELGRLETVLHKGFLTTNMKDLYAAYREGNTDAFLILFDGIEGRVKQMYALVNMDYKSIGGTDPKDLLQGLDTRVQKLQSYLKDSYYLSPRYEHNIQTIRSWSTFLNNYEFGKGGEETIPSYLSFE